MLWGNPSADSLRLNFAMVGWLLVGEGSSLLEKSAKRLSPHRATGTVSGTASAFFPSRLLVNTSVTPGKC